MKAWHFIGSRRLSISGPTSQEFGMAPVMLRAQQSNSWNGTPEVPNGPPPCKPASLRSTSAYHPKTCEQRLKLPLKKRES